MRRALRRQSGLELGVQLASCVLFVPEVYNSVPSTTGHLTVPAVVPPTCSRVCTGFGLHLGNALNVLVNQGMSFRTLPSK